MTRPFTPARWLALPAVALFVGACAQSNGDVNRVQPNVIRKRDLLDGEWYFRNTVTYTPHNTTFTYPGQTGRMEKLVWEVQENALVGYRSYPFTVGAEANVDPKSIPSGTTAKYCDRDGKCVGGQKYYGAPVVAFRILSHFDIQRTYNTQTGEPTNVIVENTTDRYWNEREYMRVNWSANVLNVLQGMMWSTIQNPAGPGVQNNWIQPNEKGEDPQDWPTFEYEGEGDARKLKYLDVTGRYLAMPDTVFFEGWGAVPVCWFARGIYDCSSSEIKMRVSIAKVDPMWVRDYEPLLYGNDMMSMFGLFRTERLNWDRRYGWTESARILLGERHRLWKEYYQKDANGQPDVTRPIPPEQRQVRPLVYYFTHAKNMGGQERYDEFMEPGRVIERDFDRAFRRTVAAVQNKRIDEVKQVYFLCDNPVKKGNPVECGKEGFSPKFGDLRYSFMNTVAEPVANGLLGYGPSSADPETGQIISGNSNTYTWGVDLYGRSVVDWILLQAGEKDFTDYISGRDVMQFIKDNPVYNLSSLNKRYATAIESELQGIPQRNEETPGAFARPSARLQRLLSKVAANGGLKGLESRRDEMRVAAETLAQHPTLESAVVDNPEMAADLLHILPPFARAQAERDPSFRRQMARIALTNYATVADWEKRRLEFFSKNNIYMAEFFDRTLVGVANELLSKRDETRDRYIASGNPRCSNTERCTPAEATRFANDDMAKFVRQQVWLSTSLHEMGHTLNLRHNFQGSWDAVNFHDEYWPLRKATITVLQNGQPVLPRTPNDLKAAAEGTESQRLSKIHNYEYSSIMDYAGKIFTDWNGLGKYDEAAIIFAYSAVSKPGTTGAATTDTSYVEVFNAARRETRQFRDSRGGQTSISGAAVDLPLVNVTHTNPNVRNYTERFHYSLVPLHFGEGPDITSVIDNGIERLKDRRLVKYEEVRRDEERVRAILEGDPSLANDPDRANGIIGTPLLRVPYMFCSDESADGPVQSCYRFDRGADYYEQTRSHLEDYWNYYLDTHFRRDRAFFNGNGAFNSAFRTFFDVANSYKHYMLELYKAPDRNQEQRITFRIDPVLQDLWTVAVIDGINQHLNVMSVPPFGLFMYRSLRTTGPRWDLIDQGDDFDSLTEEGRRRYEDLYRSRLGAQTFGTMPRGVGRRMFSRYDFKSGYNFFTRMSEAGHYMDQVGAMFAAVIPDIEVQGLDTDSDQNRYNIPYYLLFKDEMTDTFGALWGNDELKIRPIAYKRINARGEVSDTLGLDWRVYVKGSDIFENFNYPPAVRTRCTGNAQPPACFSDGQFPAPANIQMTWTSRIYSLFLGMALFRVNYDLDYAKANQIWRLGGAEDFTVAPGFELVEVPDVTTGSRYVATRPACPPGQTCPETAATALIRHSQDILLMVQDPTRCPLPDYLTIQGYGCLAAEQANNPRIVEDRRRFWTEIFRDSVRDLDLARSFYGAFGKGLLTMTSTRNFDGDTMKRSFRSLFIACGALAAACSQPELIDRTQPNYLKKSDFLDGQWYIKETIVDAPKTPARAGVVGSGGGRLEKVRWEIQENMLVGYRSYEVVPGADPRVDPVKSKIGDVRFRDGRPFKGNPVFAYRIESHFDRQRQYNPATGEVQNVLVEDTADRPWFQREYMRVDWRVNLVANLDSISSAVVPGDEFGPPPALFLRTVTDQDQNPVNESMVFTCSDGKEYRSSRIVCPEGTKLTYIDLTTQRIVDPPAVFFSGYGRLPLCFFNPVVDCESGSVKVRTALMKVDQQRVEDYEPLVYSDKLMVKFGFFRNELYTYNKDRYYTYTGQQFFAMRHNIWLKAREEVRGADGKPQVDPVTGHKLYRTIPVTRRDVRPIVYYMTDSTPRYLWGKATMRHAERDGFNPKETIEASWDRAFRKAVAVPRGLDWNSPEVPQMFYVCESPVQEGSPAACGKPGTYARLGDLRFHMAPYVEQNVGGLLGLGPSAMDPETGEVVNAVANVYGPTLDTWAGSSAQVIDVVNGEISLSELVTGKDIRDYVASNLNPTDPRRPRTGPYSSQQPLVADPSRPNGSFTRPTGRLADLLNTWKAQGLPLLKANRKATVEQILRDNPSLEDSLVNLPEVRAAVMSYVPNRDFTAKLASDQSFYRSVARALLLGNDPIEKAHKELVETVDPTIGCYYEFSYSDEDYIGVARRKAKLQADLIARFKAQGNPACANPGACSDAEAKRLAKDEVYNDLRREAYRSVMEHEIGHTLGLRHNFIGSADALNYQDGYWDLRKETIGVIVGGRRVLPITPQNMVDAAKQNERQQNEAMYEYQYSSIMDYGSRVNAMNMGTGKYDDAAILFAYSGGFEPGWVEVFNETRNDYQRPSVSVEVDNLSKVFTARGAHVEIPLSITEHYTPVSNLYTDKFHYATLPFHFADATGSFEERLNQGISRMKNRSYRKWSEMQKHYDRLNEEVKSYNLNALGLGQRDIERSRIVVNNAGGRAIPVEVPYMFCADFEVGANLLCNRQDQGADVYEMTSKWIERFNQSYIFSNFRRDRLMYSPSAVASGKFGRFLGNVPNVYQQWLFNIYYLVKYLQLSPEELDEFYGLGDPIWQNYWTMAVVDSTNLLMQQLAVPSAGYHGKRADGTWEYIPTGDALNRRLSPSAEAALRADVALPARGGYTDLVYVPRGPGRSMFTVFDSFGYDNYARVNEAGHFWDVFAAMLALITSETNFLGVDRGSDALRYSLPYYLTFNEELAPLFGNFFTENTSAFAPMLAKNADGTATIQLPTFIKASDYIFGFNYPVAASTPVDGSGNPMPMSKVLPITTWSARFWSLVWSMAFFTDNFNLEYAEFTKIYRLGGDEALDPAPGYDVVQFADPFGGGYVYAALRKLNDPKITTGAAIVLRAQQEKAKWDQARNLNQRIDGLTAVEWEARVRETVRNMEIMRGLYRIFGRAL